MKQLFFKSTVIATLAIGTMSCSRTDDVHEMSKTPELSTSSTSLKTGEKTSLRASWNQHPTWSVGMFENQKTLPVTAGKRVVVSVFNDSYNGQAIVSFSPISTDFDDISVSPRSHKVFTFVADSSSLSIHIQKPNNYASGQVSVVVHYEI